MIKSEFNSKIAALYWGMLTGKENLMDKWFQKELKERGFSRYKSRKAYGQRLVNGIEFYIRLINHKYDKEIWYPEFGVNLPYEFGLREDETLKVLTWFHIYQKEMIEADSSTDNFTESSKGDLLELIDAIVIPWLEKHQNIPELIKHFLWRIENDIDLIPHKSYENDTGALAGLLNKKRPKGVAKKFWEDLSILYNLIGDFDNSLNAIKNFLKYCECRFPNLPKKNPIQQRITKINLMVKNGQWPSCISGTSH